MRVRGQLRERRKRYKKAQGDGRQQAWFRAAVAATWKKNEEVKFCLDGDCAKRLQPRITTFVCSRL
jgi:hypothetical protein